MPTIRSDLKSIIAQLRPHGAEELRRRALLPAWIRFFSWIFLALSAAIPGAVLTSVVTGVPISVQLYGVHYRGSVLDLPAFLIVILVLLSGSAAYGLLWGRPWGIDAGLGIGFLGLTVSLVAATSTVLAARAGSSFRLPIDPLFQVPFLVQLWRRQKAWEAPPASAGEGHAA